MGFAHDYYRDSSFFGRLLARWRPAICPFEPILEEIEPGAHMLDVGCGNGLLLCTAVLARQVNGTGCDPSTKAIADANRMAGHLMRFVKATNRQGSVRFSVSDDTAALPVGAFDVVTMIDVMHHVPPKQQERFLHRAAERVVAGGTFVYKDISTAPVWMAWVNRLHDLIVAKQWIHYLPAARVVQLMAAMGFDLKGERRYRKLWYMHELAVFHRRHSA